MALSELMLKGPAAKGENFQGQPVTAYPDGGQVIDGSTSEISPAPLTLRASAEGASVVVIPESRRAELLAFMEKYDLYDLEDPGDFGDENANAEWNDLAMLVEWVIPADGDLPFRVCMLLTTDNSVLASF